jgi:mRNA interferase ChpB
MRCAGQDGPRFAGLAVSMSSAGCKTHGVALINKIHMLDLVARHAKRVERVPQVVIDDAIGRLTALLE